MEGRSFSTTALAVSGAAVLVALVVLVIKVRGAAPEPDVDPAELSRARSASAVQQPGEPPAQDAPARDAPPRIPPPRIPPPAEAGARRSGLAWSGGEPRVAGVRPPIELQDGAAADPAATETAATETAATDGPRASAEVAIEYYDRGEYDSARTAAISALQMDLPPPSVDKMLRIAASASCFMGEPEQARVHYEQLAPRSQRDIARRCRRMGIEF